MSIKPDSPWRGGCAFLPQPVNAGDILAAQRVVEKIYQYNVRSSVTKTSLPDITYRSSEDEIDITNHVFRWDRAPYETIFQNGFQARRQEEAGTPEGDYYNLELFGNSVGTHHLDTPPRSETPASVFISSTISSSWFPTVNTGVTDHVYRYEIYAPGGILVSQTLGTSRYHHKSHDEVAFPVGIAPQYIRSAQLFQLSNDGANTRRRRANDYLYINRNFNPQSHPARELRILRPVSCYIGGGNTREWRRLVIEFVPQHREPVVRPTANDDSRGNDKRQTTSKGPVNLVEESFVIAGAWLKPVPDETGQSGEQVFQRVAAVFQSQQHSFPLGGTPPPPPPPPPEEYYAKGVTEHSAGYIDAAFRCRWKNNAYIFFGGEYVLMNYAPGTTNDRIVNGPHPLGSSFLSLVGTVFAEYGIDAAFGCGYEEAMIFSTNLCARINYAPGTKNDKIIEGPVTIRQMFPFLEGTSFEGRVEAALESAAAGEAYLFKGSEYALVSYYSNKTALVATGAIRDAFPCLRGTEFESGIGAAFASHSTNQAYLFKGNKYVLIRYVPRKMDGSSIMGGPKEIVPANWPSLKGVLLPPRKNIGLDVAYELPSTYYPPARPR